MRPFVHVAADAEEAAKLAAGHVARTAAESVAARERFLLAVSGGRTPARMFEILAGEAIPWERSRVFLADERCVPAGSPESNYRLLQDHLLARRPEAAAAVCRWRTEEGAERALADYEMRLRELAPGGGAPCFDLVVLGLGEDGHTASLFPGTPAARETARWVARGEAPEAPRERLTLTFPVLDAARAAAFLATGAEKAGIAGEILGGRRADLPAARVSPAVRLDWFLDEAAASRLAPR